MRPIRALLFLLLLFLPGRLAAQEADVLTGRVTGPDNRPMSGVRVEAISAETEIVRTGVTDNNGRYMIIFPDGGGRYVVRFTFLGMAEVIRQLTRDGEELLVTNVQMSTTAIPIAGITVQAQRPQPGQGQAGEQSMALTQEQLLRLPLPDLDPNTIALLTAGITGTSVDSLSGRLGFSVAGMSDLLNQITLDGVILGEGGLQVPEAGVRRTQVTTSTFDVSRGGFAGGQVTMQTARGNNRGAGSLNYRLDDDALQMNSAATSNAYTTHNVGGSWGGPLARNRLFYNASFQVIDRVNHRFALSADDPLASQRSGVSTDSIARFLSILGGEYSLPVIGQTGSYDQPARDYRMGGRMDWSMLQGRGTSQNLSLSFNRSFSGQDSTQISTLDLFQHGGESNRESWMGRASLMSRFGTSWTNTLNLSFSENTSEQLPYLVMPEGRVRVTSQFEDGTSGTSSLVFGGNRNMPQDAYSRDLQLSDDFSFLLPIASQLHRLKVGGSIQKARNINRSTNNLYGSFTFASLADFQANNPERYERSLQERDERTGSLNTALYLGDTWRISQPLEVTLGLRWDRSELDQSPAYNAKVEELFGRRTDISPAMSGLSPRLGFNYRLSGQGQMPRALNGGIGVFAGRVPTNIFSQAVRQTGLPDAEQRLSCIGGAVPIPDWELYLSDPSQVPSVCADGGPGVPDAFSQRAPTVMLIDPEQSLPTSVRFDIGYRTQLPFNISGNFRYTYSLGTGLWGYHDINLNQNNYFTLAGENRPFFGNPGAIVPATGAASMVASRLHPEYGNVLDVVSERESRAQQLTASLNGFIGRKLTFFTNYTLGFARDQGSGSFNQNLTAGNPNLAEWATSSNDRRHTINLSLAYAIMPEVEISWLARLSSGSPFTPTVSRDINGDGTANDRAFIFDPAATADTAVASGMTRLLSNVPGQVRSCLESQLGQIADRNSCRNSWTENLDMRLSLRPNLPTVQRRLTMSLDARNVLTGLDQVVNGKDDMKGWGEGRQAESRLLEVRGFDPVAQAFRYQVNEQFGQVRRGQGSFRNPFSITLSMNLLVGGQPQMSNRPFGGGFGGFMMAGGGGFGGGDRGLGGGGGMGGGPGGGFASRGGGMGFNLRDLLQGGNVDSLLSAFMANPVRSVLELKDSLKLNEEQTTSLTALADTLTAQLDLRRNTLRPRIEGLIGQLGGMRADGPPNPQAMQTVQLEIQPQMEGARQQTGEAMRAAQRVLTEQQWAMLPQNIRSSAQSGGARAGFNAVQLIDRMLANPLPVLISLKDSLHYTPEQVAQLEALSAGLQEKLNTRREQLGKRFDNTEQQEVGRIFGDIQPDIDRTRKEVQDALKAAEKVLTREQWAKVPERVKNPFQGPGMGQGGGRRGGGF